MSELREENPLSVRGWSGPRIFRRELATVEFKSVRARVNKNGFSDHGIVALEDETDKRWLVRQYPTIGTGGGFTGWKHETMDAGSGHVTVEDLDPDHDDEYEVIFEEENTDGNIDELLTELLDEKSFDDIDDWNSGLTGTYTWGGTEAVKTFEDLGVSTLAQYVDNDEAFTRYVEKTKIKYRLKTDVSGYRDPVTNFPPATVEWRARTVKRWLGDDDHDDGEWISDDPRTLTANAGECDESFYISVGSGNIDAPSDTHRTIGPEGEAAGGDVEMVLEGPLGQARKGGFAAYVNSAQTKIYRTETATGSFAGNGDGDPARSYSGHQSYTSDTFYWDEALNSDAYESTLSADVPRRYVSDPFVDRSWRRIPFDDSLSDDALRAGFSLFSETATVRVWKRKVISIATGEPIVDQLTTTLSGEVTTDEIKAFAEQIVAGDISEFSPYSGDSPPDEMEPRVIAAKVLSVDETAYERRTPTLTARVTVSGAPDDITLTVRWRETTITSEGVVSHADQSTLVPIAAGDGSGSSDALPQDVSDGRKFFSGVACDSEPKLRQEIFMERTP